LSVKELGVREKCGESRIYFFHHTFTCSPFPVETQAPPPKPLTTPYPLPSIKPALPQRPCPPNNTLSITHFLRPHLLPLTVINKPLYQPFLQAPSLPPVEIQATPPKPTSPQHLPPRYIFAHSHLSSYNLSQHLSYHLSLHSFRHPGDRPTKTYRFSTDMEFYFITTFFFLIYYTLSPNPLLSRFQYLIGRPLFFLLHPKNKYQEPPPTI